MTMTTVGEIKKNIYIYK